MPFVVLAGTFHLVGRSRSGTPTGFEPDGDSIQFRPRSPALLDRLQRVGSPYRLTSIGSTQLRLEGIDALELHFEGHHQPRPLADRARDFLTGELDLNPVPYAPPDGLRVRPPVPKDGAPGSILSRALEVHGRPVSFAFVGEPPGADGSELRLTPTLLRTSLNYRSLARGHAYPLFYDTLFADLRAAFASAAAAARKGRRGIWREDRSATGLAVTTPAELDRTGVLFPKLYRRLIAYLDAGTGSVAGFLPWLAQTNEQVLDLDAGNFTHFDDVLRLEGETIRLAVRPERLVFVSAKTPSRAVAPWLAV